MGAGRQTDQGKVHKVMTSYDIIVSSSEVCVSFAPKASLHEFDFHAINCILKFLTSHFVLAHLDRCL